MLDVAEKYKEEIEKLHMGTWYNEKYKYYHAACYAERPNWENSNWNHHFFVSLNKDGKVIGFIGYNIDQSEEAISGLRIINFTDDVVTFGKDVKKAIEAIFTKFNFRKLTFVVIVGNPIEKQYDKLIKKFGGRVVGTYLKDSKLMDNRYYDRKVYEIFREDYLQSLKGVYNERV